MRTQQIAVQVNWPEHIFDLKAKLSTEQILSPTTASCRTQVFRTELIVAPAVIIHGVIVESGLESNLFGLIVRTCVMCMTWINSEGRAFGTSRPPQRQCVKCLHFALL